MLYTKVQSRSWAGLPDLPRRRLGAVRMQSRQPSFIATWLQRGTQFWHCRLTSLGPHVLGLQVQPVVGHSS